MKIIFLIISDHDDWEYEHERLAESEIINVDNLPYIKDAIDTDDEFQPFNFFKYPPPPILTPFSPFPPPPDLSKFTSSHNLEDEVELAMHQVGFFRCCESFEVYSNVVFNLK